MKYFLLSLLCTPHVIMGFNRDNHKPITLHIVNWSTDHGACVTVGWEEKDGIDLFKISPTQTIDYA
jgi:hypothetical protein